jgi:hypothetical protein
MAPNYRSLVPGGFFSSTPMDKSTGPVTIRMNNPGAINGASWETTYPGFVSTVETTPGNKSTIFEAPEYGVGAWWNLLRIYRTANTTTVGGIINRYGGGQDYSAYIQFVVKATGFTPDIVIDLNNDQQVLAFGRAMFRYEAGRALPWSDDQILYGIRGGRALASTGQWPASPPVGPAVAPAAPAAAPVAAAPAATGQLTDNDLLPMLQKLLVALAGSAAPAAPAANPPAAPAAGNPAPSTPAAPANTTAPILSPIDKIFGGQALVGYKSMLGVIAYVVVALLKAGGVLGAATPAGQILSVLSIAFTVLGGLAKVDRMTQSIGAVAANAASTTNTPGTPGTK